MYSICITCKKRVRILARNTIIYKIFKPKFCNFANFIYVFRAFPFFGLDEKLVISNCHYSTMNVIGHVVGYIELAKLISF